MPATKKTARKKAPKKAAAKSATAKKGAKRAKSKAFRGCGTGDAFLDQLTDTDVAVLNAQIWYAALEFEHDLGLYVEKFEDQQDEDDPDYGEREFPYCIDPGMIAKLILPNVRCYRGPLSRIDDEDQALSILEDYLVWANDFTGPFTSQLHSDIQDDYQAVFDSP